jgi:glutamate racemase
MGEQVTLVSSAEETTKDLVRVLTERDLLSERDTMPRHEFVATGSAEPFARLAQRFMGFAPGVLAPTVA